MNIIFCTVWFCFQFAGLGNIDKANKILKKWKNNIDSSRIDVVMHHTIQHQCWLNECCKLHNHIGSGQNRCCKLYYNISFSQNRCCLCSFYFFVYFLLYDIGFHKNQCYVVYVNISFQNSILTLIDNVNIDGFNIG